MVQLALFYHETPETGCLKYYCSSYTSKREFSLLSIFYQSNYKDMNSSARIILSKTVVEYG